MFVGLIIMAIAVVGFFIFGSLTNPQFATAYVAVQDIAQGTLLADLPDSAFQTVPVASNSQFAGSLVSDTELAEIRAAGGAFVNNVLAGDPIVNSAIASSANNADANNPALANSDPNMVIFGLIAAAVTFGFGRLIGANIGG